MRANILQILTKAINKLLESNTLAMQYLATNLANTAMFLEIEDFGLSGYIVFTDHGLLLQKTSIKDVDVKISGRVMALIGMSTLAKQSPKNAWPKDINFSGDHKKIEQIRNWLNILEVDWSFVLAPYIGDFLADKLVTGIASSFEILNAGVENLQGDLKNWVNDENSLFVAKAEVEAFLDDVDKLRQTVDRLSCKIDLLDL